jgi:hypothetical protein
LPRIAYFDCFSGAAGDMILAALLDAGLPLEVLHDTVRALKLAGVSLAAEKVQTHGLAATRVHVFVDASTPRKHRHLHHIDGIIDDAALPPQTAERAKSVFRRLAEAEAKVHATTIEKVHFHEVGAEDAIVDIVGACAGLDALGVTRIICSPMPPGSGTLACEHGVMPVPAPATAELLKGIPLARCDEPGEIVTPTGAAILTTLAGEFGPPPEMTLSRVGVGAGSREGRTRPNVLRLLLGEAADAGENESDMVTVLECQLDDATGQALAFACDRALAAGALDAYIVPIIMKKGRPGQLVTVLCRAEQAAELESLLLRETGTFGVRRHECRRAKLAREQVSVQTRFGPIRVKVGRRGDDVLRAWPEYEDCAAAALAHGVPLRVVQDEALSTWTRNAGVADG